MPGSRHLETSHHAPPQRLNVTNALHVIPSVANNVMLAAQDSFPTPLYWALPHQFLRDQVKNIFKKKVKNILGIR